MLGDIIAVMVCTLLFYIVSSLLVIDAALPTAVFSAVIAEQYKKNSLLLSGNVIKLR